MSPKWPILCRVGRKNLTQSINHLKISDVNKDLTLKAKDRTFEGLNHELDI